MRPVSQAQPAISTRLRAPSLVWMLAMWVFTVLSEMNSSSPISELVQAARQGAHDVLLAIGERHDRVGAARPHRLDRRSGAGSAP